jgi:hypothetical protein
MGNNNDRAESGVTLAPWTGNQSRNVNAASGNIQGLLQQLQQGNNPQALAALQAALFDPAAQQIQQQAARSGAQNQAVAARKGTGPSSRAGEMDARLQAGTQQALAGASNQATTGAYGLQAQQQAGLMNQVGVNQGVIDSNWRNRLGASGTYSQTPGAGINAGIAGIGNALTNQESYWNTSGGFGGLMSKANDLFGGI